MLLLYLICIKTIYYVYITIKKKYVYNLSVWLFLWLHGTKLKSKSNQLLLTFNNVKRNQINKYLVWIVFLPKSWTLLSYANEILLSEI